MKITRKAPWIAAGLMLMLVSRPGAAQSTPEQDSSSRQRYAELTGTEVTPQNAPANQPSGTTPQSTAPAAQTLAPAQDQTQSQDRTQNQDRKDDQQQPPAQQPPVTQRPAGTAAAETDTAGAAASRPAGMAIAPAKQRRSRAFWLKMGAVAGAGVALGTTLGLSKATNSKPPGTH